MKRCCFELKTFFNFLILSTFDACSINFAPNESSKEAVAYPIPAEAPVIKIVLFLKFKNYPFIKHILHLKGLMYQL